MKSFNECQPGDIIVFENDFRYVEIKVTKVDSSDWVTGIIVNSKHDSYSDAVGHIWHGSFVSTQCRMLTPKNIDDYEIF